MATEADRLERQRVFVTMHATFKDEEKCRVAMETIVSDAHAAYGVHSHFWFRSDDGRSLFVVEQYADERALRMAVRRFTSARVSFFRSIKVDEVAIYGDVSFIIKMLFAALRPKYMSYHDGYSKHIAKVSEPGIKGFERKRVFVATNATFTATQSDREAVGQSVTDSYAEPGISSQFWTASRDGDALFALEQFADDKALTDLLTADPTCLAAFLKAIDVGDVTVYGVESEEAKAMLAPLGPIYMNYYGGYSK